MALTRGPYIQLTSRRDAQIIWFTNVIEDSIVDLGTVQTNLNMRFRNSTTVSTVNDTSTINGNNTQNYKHVVKVSGLNDDTVYFYSISSTNSGTILPSSTNVFFRTMPSKNNNAVGNNKRIWVVADMGVGASPQDQVANTFITYDGNNPVAGSPTSKINSWIWVGDNAYSSGTYGEYDGKIFGYAPYTNSLRNNNLFTTLGNHDYSSGNYFNLFNMPRLTECGGVASFDQRYFSFEVGNIHFISLDNWITINSINTQLMNWLRVDLQNVAGEIASGIKKWIVVFAHCPPYTQDSGHSTYGGTQGGQTGSETQGVAFRTNVVPLLYTYGVDLCLYGHVHNYERSRFVRDYVGNGSNFSYATWAPEGANLGTTSATAYKKWQNNGMVHVVTGHAGAGAYTLGRAGPSGNENFCNNANTDCFNGVLSPAYTYGCSFIDVLPAQGNLNTILGQVSDRLRFGTIMRGASNLYDEFFIDK